VHLIASLWSQRCSFGRYIPRLIPPSRHNDNESCALSFPWVFLMRYRRHIVQVQRSGTVTFLESEETTLCRLARIFGYFRLQSPSSRDLARSPPALRFVWLASNALFSRASLTSRESWNRYTNLCRFNFWCYGDTEKIWWRVCCWMLLSLQILFAWKSC